MSADYGYINARVRGLKAKLLSSDFFTQALDAPSFEAFTSTLSQSPYGRNLEEAQARFEGLKALDSALARNVYQTARSILSFSDGKPHKLIALILLRYDLYNIKAIARAKHAGRSAEDVKSVFFPAGKLSPTLLEAIASASDMAGVAQALVVSKTPLRSAFTKAATQYQSDGDLYKLELALDKEYYRVLVEALKAMPSKFAKHIQREIDATNLRTALKLQGQNTEESLFISGGKEINQGLFDSIVAGGGSALQGLATTSFAAVAESERLADADIVIRELLDLSAKRLAADPLNIGVVTNFLRMKEAETAKLRLLARGKYYGVPRETLVKELGNA